MLNVKKEDRARREKVEEAYKQKLEEVQAKDAKGALRVCDWHNPNWKPESVQSVKVCLRCLFIFPA